MYYKSLCFLSLVAAGSLSAYVPAGHERSVRNPSDNVQIYNENYYPPSYGYGYYGSPMQTPAEAFPDDAEAQYLFEKMNE